MNQALLSEVFNSIQGEGLYIGERQTFIRFASCNLSCQYCDTPQKAGYPVTVEKLVELVAVYNKYKEATHSISLTGGEPLLQVEFLKTFIPVLKKSIDLPIYLETNGVLPDHLSAIIELVEIIACDIKLPSMTGSSPYWQEHQQFIEIADQQKLFVKIVFGKESTIKELETALKIITTVNNSIPLVLQPVTPTGQIRHRPGVEQIMAFQTLAKRKLKEVRVIPQVHKILGIL
jgi:organic radical activating enzyme